jgi:hypothetical protein
MRRLVLVLLGCAIVALVVYRARSIDRWERELAIGNHVDDRRSG